MKSVKKEKNIYIKPLIVLLNTFIGNEEIIYRWWFKTVMVKNYF